MRCRNALWATGSSRNHEDTGHPAVREFRDATKGLKTHTQWQVEGWEDYTAGGLLVPVVSERQAEPPKTRRTCLSVARWTEGRARVSQGDLDSTCFDVPQLPYQP